MTQIGHTGVSGGASGALRMFTQVSKSDLSLHPLAVAVHVGAVDRDRELGHGLAARRVAKPGAPGQVPREGDRAHALLLPVLQQPREAGIREDTSTAGGRLYSRWPGGRRERMLPPMLSEGVGARRGVERCCTSPGAIPPCTTRRRWRTCSPMPCPGSSSWSTADKRGCELRLVPGRVRTALGPAARWPGETFCCTAP